MTRKLYKYVGPDAVGKVLPATGGGVFKCSLPKDFNDPYELFLSIDPRETPELLAFYADVIGELPQLPTTCFSRSPAVLPMWAHHAQNSEGFVVEVDEARLAEQYPESGFADVEYRDRPDPSLNESLAVAYETCKPRHTYMLRKPYSELRILPKRNAGATSRKDARLSLRLRSDLMATSCS